MTLTGLAACETEVGSGQDLTFSKRDADAEANYWMNMNPWNWNMNLMPGMQVVC